MAAKAGLHIASTALPRGRWNLSAQYSLKEMRKSRTRMLGLKGIIIIIIQTDPPVFSF